MLRAFTLLALLGLALAFPAQAAADPYLPPPGQVWSGLTAGYDASDFEARTGKHPAIWQHFVAWGGSLQYTFDNTRSARARLMYHIGTSKGQDMPERLSPGDITRGEGDRWLVGLTRGIAEHGSPAYIRLMGEMNNCHNPYASYGCSGSK